MQACDTIQLMCGMDFNSLIANKDELIEAMVTVLQTDLKQLPVEMIKPIAAVQEFIHDFFDGRLRQHEDFDGSAGAEVLYL